jgi:hypothetical protein
LHSPATQFSPPEQAWPHEPQLSGSAVRFTQAPAQAVAPAPQSVLQTPVLHTWLAAQAWPQLPQFLGSRLVWTQAPPQSVIAPPPPPTAGQPQLPLLQTCPLEQVTPQPPQLFVSVAVATQAPAQFVVPAPHEATQVPDEHTWLDAHLVPQVPQFAGSVTRSAHWPLHVTVPGGQLHLSFEHDCPPLQVTPHAPQFVRLDVRSTQAPAHEVRLPAPASDIEQLFVHAPW